MTFDQVKQHFGGVYKAARTLGYRTAQTVYKWERTGVPRGAQYRIQVLTGGVLKANESWNGKKKARKLSR